MTQGPRWPVVKTEAEVVASDGRGRLRYRVIDLVVYAAVLTGLLTAAMAVLSLLVTRRLVGAKWALFLTGFFLMALGAWKVRPPPAWRPEARLAIADTRGKGALQGLVDSVPPLRQATLADHERFSDGVKLLVASFLVLGMSILMEVAGVGP